MVFKYDSWLPNWNAKLAECIKKYKKKNILLQTIAIFIFKKMGKNFACNQPICKSSLLQNENDVITFYNAI